jgi:DNA-directed RNA polymerase subunit RPC12/RpoP
MKCTKCGKEMELGGALLDGGDWDNQVGYFQCPKCGTTQKTSGMNDILGAAMAADAKYEARQRHKKVAIVLAALVVIGIIIWLLVIR